MSTIKQARARGPVHVSHAQESWDAEAVHAAESTPWVRGASLEMPPARKGFRQRWVRTMLLGDPDSTNLARKSREGWKPRAPDTVPANFTVPTIAHGQFAGCIGVEGSVLMEMPEVLAQKRDKFFADKRARVTNGIEAELQSQSTSKMPIEQERSSRVGRMIKVAEDTE